jgi:hypothetical protein
MTDYEVCGQSNSPLDGLVDIPVNMYLDVYKHKNYKNIPQKHKGIYHHGRTPSNLVSSHPLLRVGIRYLHQ